MAHYRKKPVVVEAVRYMGGEQFDDLPNWLSDAIFEGDVGFDSTGLQTYSMGTICEAACGDYVVRGTAGELYAVKAEIFAEIYEAAD